MPASSLTDVPHIVNFRAADSGVIALTGQIDGTLKCLLQTYVIELSVCLRIVSGFLTKEYVNKSIAFAVINIIN